MAVSRLLVFPKRPLRHRMGIVNPTRCDVALGMVWFGFGLGWPWFGLALGWGADRWDWLRICCCHNFSQHRFSRLFLKFVSFLHHWCLHVRSCPRIRKKNNIIISDSSCASPTQNDFSMYVWARSCFSCCAQSRSNRFGNQSEPIGAKGNRREPKAMKPHVGQ